MSTQSLSSQRCSNATCAAAASPPPDAVGTCHTLAPSIPGSSSNTWSAAKGCAQRWCVFSWPPGYEGAAAAAVAAAPAAAAADAHLDGDMPWAGVHLCQVDNSKRAHPQLCELPPSTDDKLGGRRAGRGGAAAVDWVAWLRSLAAPEAPFSSPLLTARLHPSLPGSTPHCPAAAVERPVQHVGGSASGWAVQAVAPSPDSSFGTPKQRTSSEPAGKRSDSVGRPHRQGSAALATSSCCRRRGTGPSSAPAGCNDAPAKHGGAAAAACCGAAACPSWCARPASWMTPLDWLMLELSRAATRPRCARHTMLLVGAGRQARRAPLSSAQPSAALLPPLVRPASLLCSSACPSTAWRRHRRCRRRSSSLPAIPAATSAAARQAAATRASGSATRASGPAAATSVLPLAVRWCTFRCSSCLQEGGVGSTAVECMYLTEGWGWGERVGVWREWTLYFHETLRCGTRARGTCGVLLVGGGGAPACSQVFQQGGAVLRAPPSRDAASHVLSKLQRPAGLGRGRAPQAQHTWAWARRPPARRPADRPPREFARLPAKHGACTHDSLPLLRPSNHLTVCAGCARGDGRAACPTAWGCGPAAHPPGQAWRLGPASPGGTLCRTGGCW